jgi:hypothetical protein
MILALIKGDTIILEGTLNTVITGWKVRCEIYDRKGGSIKLASANSGGSDDQIKILDALTGKIQITVSKQLTTKFEDRSYIEVEFETNDTPSKIFTALQDEISFKCSRIDWEIPS